MYIHTEYLWPWMWVQGHSLSTYNITISLIESIWRERAYLWSDNNKLANFCWFYAWRYFYITLSIARFLIFSWKQYNEGACRQARERSWWIITQWSLESVNWQTTWRKQHVHRARSSETDTRFIDLSVADTRSMIMSSSSLSPSLSLSVSLSVCLPVLT